MHVQLDKQAVEVAFDGRFGNEQRTGDVVVALAERQQLQHVELTRRHFGQTRALGQARGDVRGNVALVRIDGADGAQLTFSQVIRCQWRHSNGWGRQS